MDTKPIFIIRLNGSSIDASTLVNIKGSMMLEYPKMFIDYYVIFASGENKHVQFECYNPSRLPKKENDKILSVLNKILEEQSVSN